MSWRRLVYYPELIKTHIVHDSVVDIVIEDISKRYEKIPSENVECESLRIDPGGMMCINAEPNTHVFKPDSKVQVNPEHILGGTYRWTRTRELERSLPSDEKIIKVYMSDYLCVVVPESMHTDIGAWLALMSAEGYVARAELAEAFSDNPNIHVVPPPPRGDA
jgi:hypothetical protein